MTLKEKKRMKELLVLLQAMHEYCVETEVPYHRSCCECPHKTCMSKCHDFKTTYDIECPLCGEYESCKGCPWLLFSGELCDDTPGYTNSPASILRIKDWLVRLEQIETKK